MSDTATTPPTTPPAAPAPSRTAEARSFFSGTSATLAAAPGLQNFKPVTDAPASDAVPPPASPTPAASAIEPDVPLTTPALPARLREHFSAGDVARTWKAMSAAGFSTATAQKAVDFYAGRLQDTATHGHWTEGDAVQFLRSDWGASFDHRLRLARAAASALGLLEPLRRAGLTNDAPLLRYLSDVGRHLAKQPAAVQRLQEVRRTTRADAQRELDAIMHAEADHPYWSKKDPVAHREAVANVDRLAGIVHGTRPLEQPGVDPTLTRPQPTTDAAVATASDAVQAQQLMDEWLAAGPRHALNDPKHRQHKETVEHFNRLTAIVARANEDSRARWMLKRASRTPATAR
jgi:hypothetical protein